MEPDVAAVMAVLAGRPPEVEGGAEGRVVALLGHNGLEGLAAAEAPGWPGGAPEWAASLKDAYRFQAFRSTLVLESGDRALEVLREAGVDALPFKGLALFRGGVYRDPGARALEDSDILVPPDRVPRAVEALTSRGFEPWSPWDPRRMTWLSSVTFTDTTAPAGTDVALDLHWATPYARLRQAGPWPPDPLWEGAREGLPAPEPHFVLVGEHVLKHLRVVAHVRGLGDLARMAPALRDGDLLVRQARRRGSLPGLRTLVAFLEDGLGVRLPEEAARALAVGASARSAARRHLDLGRLLTESASGAGAGAGSILGAWGLIGSRWASLWEWARVAAPSGRWLGARYPEQPPLARRLTYLRAVAAWATGRGVSPLSPNQEWVR